MTYKVLDVSGLRRGLIEDAINELAAAGWTLVCPFGDCYFVFSKAA